MRRTGDRQAGFNLIEAVIVVVAIGILAAAGWFVYQHNRPQLTDAVTGTPTSSQPSNQQPTTAPTVGTLDIKEWDVHLTRTSTTASLYYYIDPNEPNIAYLSLHDIAAVAPLCAADKGGVGAISRLTPAQHQAALDGTAHSIPGTIHIGDYWYGYEKSQAECTNGSAQQAAVKQAAPNFDANTLQTIFTTLATD